MTILVTGGAGYIGSHTVAALIKAGRKVRILDNLSNSKREVLNRIETVAGMRPEFQEGDILSAGDLDKAFSPGDVSAVVHFAGLKAVGESVERPLLYYKNNVAGTLSLCEAMERHGVRSLVFSSSATVYGTENPNPLTENMPAGGTTNPYGTTKHMIEEILKDLQGAEPDWRVALLRYFNPIGAHESGLMGEDPRGIPNNLMPYVTQVAVGRREHLTVFGDDYDTPDGTGVRDYIHVVDLAAGHLKALEKLEDGPGLFVYNLGTGRGSSVLEVVAAFEKATGVRVPCRIAGRRQGDVAACWADPGKAQRELGWKAERDLETMCRDSWNWQKKNPKGY